MKTLIKTILCVLIVYSTQVISSSLTFDFSNPAFSGEGYSSHVLSIEQLQYNRSESVKDDITSAAAKEARDEKIEAEKLEMLREEFIEGKRKTRLDALIAFKQARVNDPTEKAMRTTLRNLKSMTLPNDVASYLAASGEGDQIFEVWKSRRGKDLSDKY